jgi:hypothetical protein
MAQMFGVGGVPIGGAFVVNATTAGNQYGNQVGTPLAMRPDGRFVVVWSHSPTAGTSEIRGQRFERDGSRLGAEFVVDAGGSGESYYANLAIAPHGTFVVVWTGGALTGDANVYGRIFDASANPLGAAFRVNEATTGTQTVPRVAMDRRGVFVVVWQDRDGRDGSGHGVFAQRFDPAGQRLGAEFVVNAYTTGNQYSYSVAATPDGRFVVTWDSPQDGSGFGVYAKQYDASGLPIGPEFRVNSATAGGQTYGAAAVDHAFTLAASWQSTAGDGSGFGVRSAEQAVGGPLRELAANSYTALSQHAANVAMDEVGNFLVTWHGDRQDGSDLGIFAQRYNGMHAQGLRVDGSANGVFEPGDAGAVQPTWTNYTPFNFPFPIIFASISNPEGPPGGVPQITSAGAAYDIPLGASAECDPCPTIAVPNPSPRPAAHWDMAVTEQISFPLVVRKRWVLHVGSSFSDVPVSNPFYRFVETLLHHGVTGGCTASAYCPAAVTTREQLAVFVLTAREGPGYTPPACTTPVFADLPASSPFCRWVEELSRRGVVGGCGGGNYCPASAVSREQMAVFVLRTAEPTFTPPPCASPGMFPDVPATSPFCRWIEELARRGIVTGCGGGNYCPLAPVTREQMGVFIGGTFALSLYGL